MNESKPTRPRQQAVQTVAELVRQIIALIVVGVAVPVLAINRYSQAEQYNFGYLVLAGSGVILIFLAGSTAMKLPAARKLDREGILTDGVIIDKWKSRGGFSSYHNLGYRYGEKNTYSAYQQVRNRTFRSFALLDKVKVRHLPNDPDASRLELG